MKELLYLSFWYGLVGKLWTRYTNEIFSEIEVHISTRKGDNLKYKPVKFELISFTNITTLTSLLIRIVVSKYIELTNIEIVLAIHF